MTPACIADSDERLAPWVPIALRLLRWAGHRLTSPPNFEAALTFIEILRKRRIDSLLYLACEKETASQTVYDRYWTEQRLHHISLLREFELRGIPVITFKGAEFLARNYGRRSLGFLADVDILVERKAVAEVKRICEQLGWRQAALDVARPGLNEFDTLNVAKFELDHYELVPYRLAASFATSLDEYEFVRAWSRPPVWPGPAGIAQAFFKLDVHWRPVVDIEADELFKRAVPSSLGHGHTLSLADHVWLTLAKLYYEVAMVGKRYLRDFAYLAPVIGDEDLDWDVLLAAHREYDLGAGLYYYLSFMDRLTSGKVPRAVLRALNPRNGTRLRDWGWQLSPLLDGVDDYPSCASLCNE